MSSSKFYLDIPVVWFHINSATRTSTEPERKPKTTTKKTHTTPVKPRIRMDQPTSTSLTTAPEDAMQAGQQQAFAIPSTRQNPHTLL
jgi:hypothetical protein